MSYSLYSQDPWLSVLRLLGVWLLTENIYLNMGNSFLNTPKDLKSMINSRPPRPQQDLLLILHATIYPAIVNCNEMDHTKGVKSVTLFPLKGAYKLMH